MGLLKRENKRTRVAFFEVTMVERNTNIGHRTLRSGCLKKWQTVAMKS